MTSLSQFLAIAGLIAVTPVASAAAQDENAHGHGTIFAAQAGNNDDARDIGGGATAIFALSGAMKESRLAYEVTFNDVALTRPWRIAIRNSGGVEMMSAQPASPAQG